MSVQSVRLSVSSLGIASILMLVAQAGETTGKSDAAKAR